MAGRPCTVCGHRDRRLIELAVAKGEPISAVSRRFDNLNHQAIRRHVADHAPKSMALAAQAIGGRDLAAGIGLNEEARDLYDRTIRILDVAEKARKLPVALLAIREARGNLELLGKLTGKLGPDATVNVVQAVKVTLRLPGGGAAQGEAPDGF